MKKVELRHRKLSRIIDCLRIASILETFLVFCFPNFGTLMAFFLIDSRKQLTFLKTFFIAFVTLSAARDNGDHFSRLRFTQHFSCFVPRFFKELIQKIILKFILPVFEAVPADKTVIKVLFQLTTDMSKNPSVRWNRLSSKSFYKIAFLIYLTFLVSTLFKPKAMSPFLDNCTFLVISVCVITLISGTEKNYIEDIAPDFYEECPCLQPMPGVNSLGDYKTGTLAECWGTCFKNSHCRSFSYSVRIVWVCDTDACLKKFQKKT